MLLENTPETALFGAFAVQGCAALLLGVNAQNRGHCGPRAAILWEEASEGW